MTSESSRRPRRLMLLGGLRYLIPVIDAAHRLGLEVVTCDYIPDNIAHKYSDIYRNVSIVDREAVLAAARELEIDGIMSFAVDPGVNTAAYVAEQMGLPFAGSFEAVNILQNKDLFRRFLADNGFNVPASGGYSTLEEAEADLTRFKFPVIVKPTDSAGSKGVTRVDTPADLPAAFAHALEHSIKGRVIVEEFIEKQGCSSDCDCFSVDGRLVAAYFNAQRFDPHAPNPYTPSAYTWPATFTPAQQAELTAEVQRLITLLGLTTGIYNVETRVAPDGRAYIMEVSPRGGGNRLAEVVRMGGGSDMITAAVRAAVGLDPQFEFKPLTTFMMESVLHSETDGTFIGLDINADFHRAHVLQTDLWVSRGEPIRAFRGANDAIGTLVMQFPTAQAQAQAFAHLNDLVKVQSVNK